MSRKQDTLGVLIHTEVIEAQPCECETLSDPRMKGGHLSHNFELFRGFFIPPDVGSSSAELYRVPVMGNTFGTIELPRQGMGPVSNRRPLRKTITTDNWRLHLIYWGMITSLIGFGYSEPRSGIKFGRARTRVRGSGSHDSAQTEPELNVGNTTTTRFHGFLGPMRSQVAAVVAPGGGSRTTHRGAGDEEGGELKLEIGCVGASAMGDSGTSTSTHWLGPTASDGCQRFHGHTPRRCRRPYIRKPGRTSFHQA